MNSTSAPQDVVLGVIARPHGLKGYVRLNSYAESADSFVRFGVIWVDAPDGRREYRVLEARDHVKGVLLKLDGIRFRDQAEALSGLRVGVDRSRLPEPEEGEFYWHDLVGLEAIGPDGQILGRVRGLFEAGEADVLVIDSPDGDNFVPALEDEVEVDLAAGKLLVFRPEEFGLGPNWAGEDKADGISTREEPDGQDQV